MLHIVTPAVRHTHSDRLNVMFERQRQNSFTANNDDPLDTHDAVYFICEDEVGNILGSARLLPTLGPTLYQTARMELFKPHAHIWECSQFNFYESELHPFYRFTGTLHAIRGQTFYILAQGIFDYCRRQHIKQALFTLKESQAETLVEIGLPLQNTFQNIELRERPFDTLRVCRMKMEESVKQELHSNRRHFEEKVATHCLWLSGSVFDLSRRRYSAELANQNECNL